jgi:hypothetical protein
VIAPNNNSCPLSTAPEKQNDDQPRSTQQSARSQQQQQQHTTREEQNMPQSVRNPRTGCKCKQPPKYTPYHHRAQALYIGDPHIIGMIHARQSRELQAVLNATILLTTDLAWFALEVQIAGGRPTNASDVLAVGAYGIALFFWQHHLVFEALPIVEEIIADMTPEEENAPTYRCDRHYKRIQDFRDDNEAKNLTNFKKSELIGL